MAKDNKGRELPKGITQRKDGRYQARYMFEGKRITIYDKDLKQLEKKLRSALYEVEHGIHAKLEKITLDAWFKTWIKEYKALTVKENTIRTYEIIYEHHIKKKLGKKKLKELRSEHIQTQLNSMARANYSNSTIELASIILNSMLKQAIKNGIISVNPMFAVNIPRKREKKMIHALTREEQEMFMSHVKGTEYEILFTVALSTGMRIGELSGLEWENVDFGNGVIKVRKTLLYQGTKKAH